ncbi:hypothetical protein PIB30_100236 [Stylosanthes scabra]|uniref:Cytochrome P450 78A5-like n=1 Tax=Stylosanthes scabra TaxID=79078 RepID=A0ABU6TZB1_9FABA|nr:hypothetical protein [Stylosanthes scabra]
MVKPKPTTKFPSFHLLLLITLLASLFLFQSSLSSFSFSFSLFTLFLFALSLNYWLVPGGFAWRNHHHHHNNNVKISGPMGWPLLGSLPQMGSLAHAKLASMATNMNSKRLMALSLGSTPVIISSHPETAREILFGSSFADRPIKASAKTLMFERAIGFAPSGTYWRHLRRIAAFHMFSPKNIQSLENLRQRIASEMEVKAMRIMEEKGFVEIRSVFQEGSLSNILESVFGSSSSSELGDMVKEGYELIGMFNLEDYFPLLKLLDFHGVKRRCHKLASKVKSVVGNIVDQRKKCPQHLLPNNNDFLTTLLLLPKEESLAHSDMVAILWEMIFRGTDTVAILLEWIMARIVLHQDIQMKVRQEIDACVGENGHVRDSNIPNLPYLQAIVKEVLRLHPPGPLLSWARLAVHDVHVDKVFVPAGTTAMVNMWAISHDSAIWEDPWAFKPERFLKGDVSIMGSDLRLAPFGAGRRVCPGRGLGLATVHIWLARLLHHFVWLPAEQSVDLSENLRLSMEMKTPLRCRVVHRHNYVSP